MTRITCLALSLLLVACASRAPQDDPMVPVAPAAVVDQPEPIERAFPDDSLYPLLVAEFALRRRNYEVALTNYLEQAPRLRDAGVSAHTTHLAQFLQQEPQALEAVTLWAELEPTNVEANNTLATLLARNGQTLAAAPHMGAVARNGGQASFPLLLSGFPQLNPDQQAQLNSAINQLAEEFPRDTQLLLTQALLLEELGQTRPALAKLKELFELEPQQTQAILLEAKLLLDSGAKKPFRHLEAVLEENPEDHQLRLQYARLLTRDDMDGARKQFEILAAQAPGDGDVLLSLALVNREVGDNLAAKAYLRQMLEQRQREDTAHYYLGRIAEDEGEPETAVYNYLKVADGRDFYSASARVGQIYLDAGQTSEFGDYFRQLRTNNPDRRERLYGIEADLLGRAGDAGSAVAVLSQGLDEFPESTSMRYARSMFGEQQNDLALMESDLRAIIAGDPDNATALNALGYTLANRTTRYDEARELITRALALQPNEPAILDSMGWVLYRLGDYPQAIAYLTRAYESFPDPEVAAHLGEVLWVSGDTRAALEIWQGALEKSPDHEVLVSTIRRLRTSEPETAN